MERKKIDAVKKPMCTSIAKPPITIHLSYSAGLRTMAVREGK